MKDDLAGEWQLIALGVDEPLKRALSTLCTEEFGIRFVGVTSSITTLLFSLEETRAEIVVVDERSLGEAPMSALASIHHAAPQTRMLIIGDTLDAAAQWDALQFLVAGHLGREESLTQVARALSAIRRGEFWLSRSQSSQLLTRLSADEIRQGGAFRNLDVLTPQENRVLQECLVGQSNKEIARVLSITEQTVKIHLQHIFQKLGVRRRAELLLRRWEGVEPRAETRRPPR